ncbi:Conserved hypothetical protein [Candidatus Phytoplasma australiense]|uniref:DUF2963 domain-containing protein n=1 Tax=Phytoplasma australiense TaxID=59748 RepID=B1V9T7_PHYAS|nr:Conserved hypothetical protein [Candidatus Phytoplasma australiense]
MNYQKTFYHKGIKTAIKFVAEYSPDGKLIKNTQYNPDGTVFNEIYYNPNGSIKTTKKY